MTLPRIAAHNNPFATDRVERVLRFRPEWAGTSWQELDARWQHCGQRACLTGRHGAGKTTFIDAWADRQAPARVLRLFLNRDHSSILSGDWSALAGAKGKIVILDGEEQLGWRQRRKFYRLTADADGLLVSRHRRGQLPTLLHFDPDIEMLERCVQALAPEHLDHLRPDFPIWWKQHRGNIREILLRCYDHVQIPKPGATP